MKDKLDLFATITICMFSFLYLILSYQIVFPDWDGACFLENARRILYGKPLYEDFRPQLLSFLIAGIWYLKGEADWKITRVISPLALAGTAICLYLALRKENKVVAYLTVFFTFLSPQITLWGFHILTHALALFLVSVTFFSLIEDKKWTPIIAGIATSLTFFSRYVIAIIPVSLIIAYMVTSKRFRRGILAFTISGLMMTIYILWMLVREGIFQLGYWEDVVFTWTFSTFYIEHFMTTFGYIFVIAILAMFTPKFLKKKAFLPMTVWFIVPFIAWSMHPHNWEERFVFEYVPAIGYLGSLFSYDWAVSLWKMLKTSNRNIGELLYKFFGMLLIAIMLCSTLIGAGIGASYEGYRGISSLYNTLHNESLWFKDKTVLEVAEQIRILPKDSIIGVSAFQPTLQFLSERKTVIHFESEGTLESLVEFLERAHADYLVVFLSDIVIRPCNPYDAWIFSNEELLVSTFGEPFSRMSAEGRYGYRTVLFFNLTNTR